MSILTLFLLSNHTLTSSNFYLLENNMFPFIEKNDNVNVPFDIFNYISYLAMSQSTVRISQSRLEYVFRNIFNLPNKNILRENIFLLFNNISNGVCLKYDFNKFLPRKFVACNLFVNILSGNIIGSITEFEETIRYHTIMMPVNGIVNTYGECKFGFYTRHIAGSVLRTVFKVSQIQIFGNTINEIHMVNYKKGKYIGGGMSKFAYIKDNVSNICKGDIISFGFLIKVRVFDKVIDRHIYRLI